VRSGGSDEKGAKVRGSVTKFNKRRLCGCISREDGREVRFDKSSLDGLNTRLLSVGDRVEFEERYEGTVLRARKVRFAMFHKSPV
jgi:cold shock CspA family protein